MYYIGIDIGGMTVKGGIIDESNKIIYKSRFETRVDESAENVIVELANFIRDILSRNNITLDDVAGIGLGIPGSIENNIVKFSNNLYWNNVPIVQLLSADLDYSIDKIYAENDANCAILGEIYFGEAKDAKDAVLVTLGTGVGTGIVSGGQLLTGSGAAGGEGGHMVINPNGPKCTCGRNGCWEAYASATALMRMTSEAIEKYPDSILATIAQAEGKVSGKTAFEAYRKGCKVGRRVVKAYLRNISIGLINIANIIRPDVIIIGGGISNEGEWLISALQEAVDKEVYASQYNPRIIVKNTKLGNDAGIYGAAALAVYKLCKK